VAVFSFLEDTMTTTFYDHWRDVPESTWRWTTFSPAEIACRGTGKLLINEPALDKCVFHDMWPPVPRACGQSFHDMWPHP